jgi:N-acetylglucosaminyl-diphospho-decaprenol L-rhamnosyltransferase
MITIIIVVYKSDIKKLNNILKKIGNKYKIILIDNSYNYDFSKINLPKKFKIIRSQNIGNGAAINLGIKYAKTPYAIYFDIDVSFDKNLIKKLLSKAIKIKKFGILLPNNGKFKKKRKIMECYELEAPIMLFNIKKLKKIGYFDEKIFLYFEETDLFFKCKKNNKKVFILNDLIIDHKRSSSIKIFKKTNLNNKILYLRHWHYMWSMFYYYKKNFNYIYGIKKTIKFFFIDFAKLIYFIIILNKVNFFIRLNRILGLITSYLFIKSYKRLE